MLRVALRGRICAGLENIAVASAHHEFRPVDANLDRASLSRTRRVLRIIAQTVLTSQLFGYRAKRHIEILLLGVIETRATHAGQVMQILISEFVFATSVA